MKKYSSVWTEFEYLNMYFFSHDSLKSSQNSSKKIQSRPPDGKTLRRAISFLDQAHLNEPHRAPQKSQTVLVAVETFRACDRLQSLTEHFNISSEEFDITMGSLMVQFGIQMRGALIIQTQN